MSLESLEQVIAFMRDQGVTRIYCKHLAENDSSKQQIYLGGSFDILRQLPFTEIHASARTVVRQSFKAKLQLRWLDEEGRLGDAPGAQLILYPDYPEVRLSGFLRGCRIAPNAYMRPIPKDQRRFNNAPDGRVLLLGVAGERVIAFLARAGTGLANELVMTFPRQGGSGPLTEIYAQAIAGTRGQLLEALGQLVGPWHASRRLNSAGVVVPYAARNGGGYTLEALLGIIPNGRSEPDYLGWELKAISSDRVTLMTPEPTGGVYRVSGVREFVRKYGGRVREDGVQYFTGVHRWGGVTESSGLTLHVSGMDARTGKISVASGGIQLVDKDGNLAAEWGYAGLVEHWARKHASAAYIKYESEKLGPPAYRFLSPVMLGVHSSFDRLLNLIVTQKVFLDPGSRVDSSDRVKARNQFRISSRHLPELYDSWEIVALDR
jgi:hypothetical protein